MDDQTPPPPVQQPGLPTVPPPAVPSPPPRGSNLPIIIAAGFIALIVVMAVVGTLAYKLHSSASPSVQTGSEDSTSSPPSLLGGGQQKARDSKRETDLATVQTQLEAYFENNGYYPSLKDMNGPAWRATNMKSLDETALADPSSSCDPAKTGCLTASPKAKAYSYAVTDSNGKSCEADDTKCALYTLTATLETGGTFAKSNLD